MNDFYRITGSESDLFADVREDSGDPCGLAP